MGWGIFEAYTATTCSIPVDVALPIESQKDFHQSLKSPGGFSSITSVLTQIDAATASASHIEDEEKIKHITSCSCGFAAVNETVRGALTNWLTTAFQKALMEESSTSADPRTMEANVSDPVDQATQTPIERLFL